MPKNRPWPRLKIPVCPHSKTSPTAGNAKHRYFATSSRRNDPSTNGSVSPTRTSASGPPDAQPASFKPPNQRRAAGSGAMSLDVVIAAPAARTGRWA